MAASAQVRIERAGFYEPQRNLPHFDPRNGAERRFALQFAKAYRAQFLSLHRPSRNDSIALAREVPVNGYGIADLVAVSWNPALLSSLPGHLDHEGFLRKARPTVRAFEVKLLDWRKALMQASRYRFFAQAALVVLPRQKCAAALKYLDTFQAVRIGLWSFDGKTCRITRHFTPRPTKPADKRQRTRVLELVARASKALPVA